MAEATIQKEMKNTSKIPTLLKVGGDICETH